MRAPLQEGIFRYGRSLEKALLLALAPPIAGAVSAVSLRDVYTGQPVALLEDASRAGSGGAGGDEAAARIHHMAFSPAGTLLVSCTGMGHNVRGRRAEQESQPPSH